MNFPGVEFLMMETEPNRNGAKRASAEDNVFKFSYITP